MFEACIVDDDSWYDRKRRWSTAMVNSVRPSGTLDVVRDSFSDENLVLIGLLESSRRADQSACPQFDRPKEKALGPNAPGKYYPKASDARYQGVTIAFQDCRSDGMHKACREFRKF
jgi:hypothetical protein